MPRGLMRAHVGGNSAPWVRTLLMWRVRWADVRSAWPTHVGATGARVCRRVFAGAGLPVRVRTLMRRPVVCRECVSVWLHVSLFLFPPPLAACERGLEGMRGGWSRGVKACVSLP